jgi:hypothetical protein
MDDVLLIHTATITFQDNPPAVYAAFTYEQLIHEVYDYIAEWWDEDDWDIEQNIEIPSSHQEAVDHYFGNHSEESIYYDVAYLRATQEVLDAARIV